jgi:drug/metabolite transporter (DMT)-like permease
VANSMFAYASSRGQVSIASVLGSLYPVVTVFWARFLLDERLRRVQQVGVALAGTGAGVTAF